MNKCRHCGVFVLIEKAFCPNCSEPIEPEEAPDRSTTSSSDMMSTLRDAPEHYRDLLQDLKKMKPSSQPAAAAHPPEADTAGVSATPPQPTQSIGYSAPQAAAPLPPASSNKRSLLVVLAILSLLILIFVIFIVFRPF